MSTNTMFVIQHYIDDTKEKNYLITKLIKPNNASLSLRRGCLVNWIKLLANWGFPPMIYRIKLQAEEILK